MLHSQLTRLRADVDRLHAERAAAEQVRGGPGFRV